MTKMGSLALDDLPSPGSSHSTSSPSPTSWLPTSSEMPPHVLRSHGSVRFSSGETSIACESNNTVLFCGTSLQR